MDSRFRGNDHASGVTFGGRIAMRLYKIISMALIFSAFSVIISFVLLCVFLCDFVS